MTDDNDQERAEELLQQSSDQRRVDTEAASAQDIDDSAPGDRVEAIRAALAAIDEGEQPPNINIRDDVFKALLVGLDETDGLQGVATDLSTQLEEDPPEKASQSDVARLAMRLGLRELPDVLDDVKEARREYMLEQAEDF